MPLNRQNDSQKTPASLLRQYALASELPFLLVGSTLIAGFLGYLLDAWLHTKPWLMIALGALGFAVGVRELLRRLGQNDDSSDTSTRSGS